LKVSVYTIERGDLRLSEETKERIRRRVREAGAKVAFEDDRERVVRGIEDAEALFGCITPMMLRNAKRTAG